MTDLERPWFSFFFDYRDINNLPLKNYTNK